MVSRKIKQLFGISVLFTSLIAGCGADDFEVEVVDTYGNIDLIDNQKEDDNQLSSEEKTTTDDQKETDLEESISVTWTDQNGKIIYTQGNVEKNSIPVFKGVIPEIVSNSKVVYEFMGWDKEITPIQKSTTYKAVYEEREPGINYTDDNFQRCHISWAEVLENEYLKVNSKTPHVIGNRYDEENLYFGKDVQIVIPASVTTLSSACFKNISNLTSIVISTSVRTIEKNTFSDLPLLKRIVIPSSVDSLDGASMFYNDISLEEIHVLANLSRISDKMFYNCSSLRYFHIPESVTSLGSEIFYNCSSLEELYIPKGITNIVDEDSLCAKDDSLESIIVDEENPIFDSRNNCNAIIRTKTNALIQGCKNTIIPRNVKRICKGAFNDLTRLTNLEIPESINVIDEKAIDGCENLETTNYKNGKYLGNTVNPYKFLYSLDLSKSLNSFVFQEDVEYLNDGIFSNARDIKKIHITKNIKKITSSMFHNQFDEITVDDNSKTYDSRDYCDAIIETRTNTLIRACKNTFIPEGVEIIGSKAFKGISVEEIELSSTVKEIQDNAFEDCSMESIILNNNLKTFGIGSFYRCRNLKTINVPSGVREIPKEFAIFCDNLKSIDLPNTITSIGVRAFYYCKNFIEINYAGTYNSFNSIKRDSSLFSELNVVTVKCSDKITYIS